jgi:two-component system chemotaxis sensor kinase CheA
MAKYRALFLEEATEHLAEMSRALLVLEKDPETGEAIETLFRMAHSIKSMAASLDYTSIAELSHRLEDRMESVRRVGRVDGAEDLPLFFRGLEALERMVAGVRNNGEAPPGDAELLAVLESAAPKKARL